MKIVIELSDETYKDIKEENGIYGINNGLSARITGKVVGAIQNGTPLPKGHGRLIDADALKLTQHDIHVESINYRHRCISIENIDEAPTIIEADKSESEDKK